MLTSVAKRGQSGETPTRAALPRGSKEIAGFHMVGQPKILKS